MWWLLYKTVGTVFLRVNNLVKINYVERLSDEKDRRVCILHLTSEGYEVISKIVPKNKKIILHNISVLDDEEKEKILYIQKIGGKSDEKKSKK